MQSTTATVSPKKKGKKIALIVVAITVLLLVVSVYSSSTSKWAVLCSEFSGRLVSSSGASVSGVKVSRTWSWDWNGESGTQEATTDKNGNFVFPEVLGSGFSARVLPHQPVVKQEITTDTKSGSVMLFSIYKHNYERNSEFSNIKGNQSNPKFICPIDAEPVADGLFYGTCK